MIDLNLHFDYSRNVAMTTNFRAKLANQPSFGMMAFQNGLQYHNSDLDILSGNILATVCAYLMKFTPVTLEFPM